MMKYCCDEDVVSLNSIKENLLSKFKSSIPIFVKKIIRNNIMLSDYYDKSGQLSKGSLYYNEFRSLINNIKE